MQSPTIVTGRVSPSSAERRSDGRAQRDRFPIFFGRDVPGRPAGEHAKDHYTIDRKYLDVPNEPLFPFGHGLTYGRFALSNLRVTPVDAEEHRHPADSQSTCAMTARWLAQETVYPVHA